MRASQNMASSSKRRLPHAKKAHGEDYGVLHMHTLQKSEVKERAKGGGDDVSSHRATVTTTPSLRSLYDRLAHPSFHPKPIDRWRVQTDAGYIFDRRVFLGLTIVILCITIYAASLMNFSFTRQVYLHCPADAPLGYCENPLYRECDDEYCALERLYPGYTYGEKPSEWYMWIGPIMVVVTLGAFLLNHFLWNRSYEFKID